MQDLLNEVERLRLRVHRKGRSHYLAAHQANMMHSALGIPVVVTTTIVGTTIFATLSKQQLDLQILTGLLSMLAAVLAALQTFFKFSERAEKHRTTSASYFSLFRAANLLKLKLAGPDVDRNKSFLELESLLSRLDKLDKDSLIVSDRLYDKAVQEQKKDEEGI